MARTVVTSKSIDIILKDAANLFISYEFMANMSGGGKDSYNKERACAHLHAHAHRSDGRFLSCGLWPAVQLWLSRFMMRYTVLPVSPRMKETVLFTLHLLLVGNY